jgi:hypothetical protein
MRHEIELRMQEKTSNKYWCLGAAEIKRYSMSDAPTDAI